MLPVGTEVILRGRVVSEPTHSGSVSVEVRRGDGCVSGCMLIPQICLAEAPEDKNRQKLLAIIDSLINQMAEMKHKAVDDWASYMKSRYQE